MLSDCRRLNGTDSFPELLSSYIYIIISRLSIFQRLERGQRGEGKANMKLDWRLIAVKKADKDALHRNHEGISARLLKARVSIKSC